jgi:hypothetical protein
MGSSVRCCRFHLGEKYENFCKERKKYLAPPCFDAYHI